MKYLIVILLLASACQTEDVSPCAKLRADSITARQNMDRTTGADRELYKQQYLSLKAQADNCYGE